MIAAIADRKAATHIVFWTGRKGLSVKCLTYCNELLDGGDNGVLQLPDDADGVCAACQTAVDNHDYPPLRR